MPQVAKIFTKVVGGVNDNTLILNTRCQLVYPFSAPNWTDLRVGFLLSITDETADDTINDADFAETLSGGDLNHLAEYTFIGVKSNNDAQSGQDVGFIGYSTCSGQGPETQTQLSSSDEAIGTTNAFFWRPNRTNLRPGGDGPGAIIMDSGRLVSTLNNISPHFLHDPTHATAIGYATLLMLRITRPTGSSHALTVSIKQGTNSSDVLFTNTPTQDVLETNLSNYPTVVQTKTVNNMANVPDAIYAYWPFHNSRLRIHALGFLKFR